MQVYASARKNSTNKNNSAVRNTRTRSLMQGGAQEAVLLSVRREAANSSRRTLQKPGLGEGISRSQGQGKDPQEGLGEGPSRRIRGRDLQKGLGKYPLEGLGKGPSRRVRGMPPERHLQLAASSTSARQLSQRYLKEVSRLVVHLVEFFPHWTYYRKGIIKGPIT